ncbi:hypothetical protein HMPREF1301_00235 [Propionibacterium sp. KPL2005]|nr:hypothetical protein HMPREF1301_00235 [Propionibacterium sp. KPL2005]ERS26749.1 hypothetical protein HMPREF1297_02339 [Propionibacterium sp. KPL2000]
MATELAQGYMSLSVGFDGKPARQIEEFLGRAQKATGRAGQEMGRALSSGVASGVEKAKANTASAQKAFETTEKAAQKASQSRANAARQVQITEAKAAEARQRYAAGSSQVLAAEDRLERAKQRAAKADLDLAAAEKRRSDASDKVKAAAQEQATAEERAEKRHRGVLGRMSDSLAKLQKRLPDPYAKMPDAAARSARLSADTFATKLSGASGSIGKRFQSSLSGALSGGVRAAGLASMTALGGAAASGVALVGTALKKGFSRLESIDEAKAKLEGLGNSAKDIDSIMANSLASVKGTAFGLEEAATTSSMLVATGIKPGKQLESTLKTVADTATIAGASMGDMGRIFSSVAARGKLQGDDMLQLTSAGVPVIQMLGKVLHKSSAEVSDMVSKGKIDFATFSKAMQQGMGGSAQSSGKTFTGAMKNMGAALGRVGANFMQGVFPKMAPLFQNITASMEPMEKGAKKVGDAVGRMVGPAFDKVTKALSGGSLGSLGSRFRGDLDGIKKSISGFSAAAKTLFGGVKTALKPVIDDVVKLIGAAALGALKLALDGIKNTLKSLSPVMSSVGGFLKRHKNAVSVLVVVIGTFISVMKAAQAAQAIWAARTLVVSRAQRILAAAQAALNVVMSLNPITLVIAALVALGVALVHAYRHSETFRRVMNRAFTSVKNAGIAIGRWFSGPFVHFFSRGFNSVKNGVMSLSHYVTSRFNAIRNSVNHTVSVMWAAVKRAFSNGRNDVVRSATMLHDGVMRTFNRLKSGAITAFTKMRDGIKRAWDGLRAVVKAPIKWVIDIPINKGLISAVAKVQHFFGVKNTMKPIKLAGFRSGGVIPGVFDPRNRDNVLAVSSSGVPTARVEPGEFVVNRAQTARNLPLLHAINSGLAGYAGGGLVGGSGRWSKEFERRMMLTAASLGATLQIAQRGFRPRTPWSGTSHRGDAVDVAGGANLWSIRDALRRQGIAAWVRGPAQNYSWHVHGIPMPGAGVALGSAVYQQQAYAAGGDGLHGLTSKDPYARAGNRADNRFGWFGRAVNAVKSWGEQMVEKAKSAFGGLANPMAFLRSKVGGMVNQITGRFGRGGWASTMAAIPGHLISDAASWAKRLWDKMSSDGGDGGPAGSPGNLESWRPMVARALAASGIGGGKADEDKWLRQIKTESDGNPRLVQSSRVYDVNIARGDPARGLVQVPKVTWADFGRDMGPFMPNVYDPYKNLIVGMRAANAQHHNWRRVIGFGHGYQDGGTVPFSQVAALSEDGRPELVVGPQMRKLNARSQVFNAEDTAKFIASQGQGMPSVLVVRDVDDQLVGRMYVEGINAASDTIHDMRRRGVRV